MSKRFGGATIGRRVDRRRREMLPIDTGGQRSATFHGDEVAHEARMKANCLRVDWDLALIEEAGRCAVAALLVGKKYQQMTKERQRQERICVRLEAEFAAQTDLAGLDDTFLEGTT